MNDSYKLGRVRERLDMLCEKFDEEWGLHLGSKHSYEDFAEAMIKDECDRLCDLHTFLRYHKEHLIEILYICHPDEE